MSQNVSFTHAASAWYLMKQNGTKTKALAVRQS
jgi:hypothetical protein